MIRWHQTVIALMMMLVVRSEAATFVNEILSRIALRHFWRREKRNQARIFDIRYVHNAGKIHRLVATFAQRFAVDDQVVRIVRWNDGVKRDATAERGD